MRCLAAIVCLAVVLPVLAQPPAVQYKIEFDPATNLKVLKESAGKQGLFVNVRFKISVEGAGAIDDPKTQYKIIIEENGHKVYEDDVPRPTPSDDLAIVMAVDTSGSMKEHGRIEKTRVAADFFLKRIPAKSDCGLILFDHEIIKEIAPSVDRQPVLKAVAEMQPRGGTAFLDAAAKGVKLLETMPSFKQRFLVLMTDGVDLNSSETLASVIAKAQAAKVRVITIGIGEPGKQELVNTVLVLDQSGSMKAPADNNEKTAKIDGLHRAASRFAAIMPTTGWASIIPFSTLVGQPSEFSNDRTALIRRMKSLRPEGETALLDAAYAGICTLDAAGRPGKKAVIAMTDGIDNCSRRRIGEVIARAKESKIPVYTLGFGREGELDTKLMQQLANETGGKYYHARNEKSLLEIFENLSIQLHDDGIDEVVLKQLARDTGGQYYPVKNISELQLVLNKVSESIQFKDYDITFPSKFQQGDGTNRKVRLKLVRRSGDQVSNFSADGDFVMESTVSDYQTSGIVVAEMHPLVYLMLLVGIGVLLLLPTMLRFKAGETS